MAAPAARRIVGAEVPIPGSDKLRWIDLTVPSSPSPAPASPSDPFVCVPPRAASGCHIILSGDSQYYLCWRIYEEHQNVLEVIELCASKEFPSSGLRLVFQEALCPFAFLCEREGRRRGELVYLLYVLTVSGVALLCHLRSPFSYVSGSILHQDDIVEFNLQTHAQSAKVTAVTAKPGCLVIGRQDGSICSYSLGKLAPDSPAFLNELRDDAGIGRLWTLMSRTKAVGPVQDIVATVVNERDLLFVLHSDGNLRIWDNHKKLLNYNVCSNDVDGHPSRLWVGESDDDEETISLAVLHQNTVVQDCDHVAVYGFNFSAGERFLFSSEPSISTIPLLEGKLVDMKIGTDKLWILKEFGSMFYETLQYDFDTEKIFSYVLQEDAISEQLFQSSDNSLDDLVWTADSMFSSFKEQAFNFISSMFLRRLLQPGVNNCSALRETLYEHKKFLSDSEIQSLTANGLQKEILSIIEQEGSSQTASATVYHWKKFSARYLHNWCLNNRPYGLLLDTNNEVFGLIRKGSFSLFRCLESVEMLIYGSSDELRSLDGLGMDFLLDDISDFELLDEVLRCMGHIHHLLGRSSTAIYYESLISSVISSDEIASQIIKMLETGFSPQSSSSLITLLGMDTYVERRQAAHKSQRKFSVEMLLSFHKLQSRSTSWSAVFDVIEKFMKCLNTNITVQEHESKRVCNVNSMLMVQATSQVARTMFECAFDLFLFLSYLVGVGGQVSLLQSDVARIKLKLFPMIQDILGQWIVLHFVGITPTSPSTIRDFSYQLSSLQLGKADELPLHRKLGCSDFTLACLLDFPKSPGGDVLSPCFPSPAEIINLVRMFSSSIMSGSNVEYVQTFLGSTLNLSAVLVRNGQYEAAQSLLGILETYLNHEEVSQAGQDADIACSAYLHLYGFCLLMLAYDEANLILRESKVHDAIRCFFRAASGHEAPKALQKLSLETGFQVSGECRSISLWRLHYYEWAMQIFEQHSMSEGACQFALAALEQVDIIVDVYNGNEAEGLPETATMIKGRLWANVFKYSLDLKHFRDAYCAIDSNPDDDSKYVCLRRFIIVLCELGETKVLCNGEIPFTDLVEKVEQELFWKAERSDLSSRPNLYKVLYSFEAYRNNWRKAAAYMYRYFVRLNREGNAGGSHQLSHTLQERLHALSAAINALQLVDPSFAWLDSVCEADDQISPSKRPRNLLMENSAFGTDSELSRLQFCVDVEILEKEYTLTEAQYMLSTVKSTYKFSESQSVEALMDVLINENLYDLAFTIVLKFWKESGMKRELEHVFSSIAQQCCPNRAGKSGQQLLLLPSSEDDAWDINTKSIAVAHQLQGSCNWETLELYLEKYKDLHPRLPVIVAETLLYTDPEIELPLWLVQMFKTNKSGNKTISWGMSGKEADPAALFRLYINYGRHAEATNLLVEYLESFASSRPVDVLHRKKMSAAWFPYTAIERLWCRLEEMQSAGHNVDQCDRLKKLLHGAQMSHLQQVVVDSEDVLSSVGGGGGQGMESQSS
ncbi:nuclear pore complex protein NUP160-like isoform X2 [Phragmites australis]|uniref:nuclear pore complex protein NUP160-like isoform X2 n=1 Tax=Phragmites australis TaxID=29695 RepID=UPI002D787BFB|nr:nuclear pore complex protein NUP160-like isoform X2 [Phragmites australis]